MRRLQQLGGRTRAANGDEVDALPRSTVSTILRGDKLPRSEFVSAFVKACLDYGGHPPERTAEAVEEWLAGWRALYAAGAREGGEGRLVPEEPASDGPWERGVPRHLPRDVGMLVDREAELQFADERFRSQPGGSVFLVTGPVGVGKSAFAVRWAHRLAEGFPDGQLSVDLRGPQGPLDGEQALGVLLGSLGVREEDCPADPWRRVEMYRSLIARRRVLVVLDNACDAEQVRPLLAAGEHCRTVVTSRNRMSGLVAREAAQRLVLGALSSEAACAVLRAVIDDGYLVDARAELEELAELCGYLPLVLRLAAVKFTDRPAQGFKSFVRGMRDGGRMLALALDGDSGNSLRCELEFSYRRLGQDAKRYFRKIGLIAPTGFTLETGAALAGIPLAEADRLTEQLESEHLVAWIDGQRFAMPRVLQAFARGLECRPDEPLTLTLVGSG